MAIKNDKYEAVIGLEVHAQLSTGSKLFCGDSAAFGGSPNTHISPITLAHPGTLPKTNKKVVEYAVKAGLACHCEIERFTYFSRKNYFYPDLPRGYQTSQHHNPVCKGGYVTIKTSTGQRNVQLNRMHMEEDAGKSMHDVDDHFTCVDLNRAGIPLLEIVTEPDLFSADEAWHYVTELRRLLRWTGVCDGNMEEGSLRCDANVSIRLKGDTTLGTRVEVKNLNSIRNIKKAIEHEIYRMIDMVEQGEKVIQQTRSFDAATDTTFPLRDKEEANDYRYFPEPDLPPIVLSDTYIQSVKEALPALPEALMKKYTSALGLTEYDASQICMEKETADYFETLIPLISNYKAAANWINGPLKQYLNAAKKDFSESDITPMQLCGIIELIDAGKIRFSAASAKLLPAMVLNQDKTAMQLATELNLIQVSDTGELETWVNTVLENMPDKVNEYKKGKRGLIGLFVGEVKKMSKGKADARLVTSLLEEKLK